MEFSFTEEQLMFKKEVFRFAKKEILPRVEEHDLKMEFDHESFKKLGEFGLLGLPYPEELGGSGADVVTATLAGEALGEAGVDRGLTLGWGAHTFLCGDTILKHGNPAQLKKYIPKLATGEWIGCMAVTEPGAGSDVSALSAKAEKRGDKYILNGTKQFITNGTLADISVVYARTDPKAGHKGVSAFIVEKGTPGYSAEKDLVKMGLKSSHTSSLVFEDCEVPEENLLGKEGEGFIYAMQTVEWDRSAMLAPFVGGMSYCLEKSIQYSKDRVQFGRPIGSFPAIKHKLADMKIFVEAARTLVYRVAWCKDQGKPVNEAAAAMAKLYIGDWGLKPHNDAVTLHGGYGYCHEYEVERHFRDGRVTAIGGGTSEIQKLIIARLLQMAK